MATPKRHRSEQEDVTTPANDNENVNNPPASERALRIPELLEMILLQLPMQDLLLAQRVSKRWQHSVQSSINLRRALFLDPVACGPVSYLDWRLDDKDCYGHKKLNLGEHLRGPDRNDKPKIYPTHWGKTRDDAGKYNVFVNPLLAKLFPVLAADGLYWSETLEDLPAAAQHEEASWKKMYITQPPVNCMTMERDSADDDSTDADWTIKQLQYTEGLDMDDVWIWLTHRAQTVWIEGRHLWKEYTGSRDLSRVEQRGGK